MWMLCTNLNITLHCLKVFYLSWMVSNGRLLFLFAKNSWISSVCILSECWLANLREGSLGSGFWILWIGPTSILLATLSAAVGSFSGCFLLFVCLFLNCTTTSLLGGCPFLQPIFSGPHSSSLSSLRLRVFEPAPVNVKL